MIRIKPQSSSYKDKNLENVTSAVYLKKDMKATALSLKTW